MIPENAKVPEEIRTARLLLRPPEVGDGPAVNEAIRESFAELNVWMAWAKKLPSVEDSERFAAEAAEKFRARDQLPMLMRLRDTDALVGATGLHRINWAIPSFEVGYWCRTSQVGRGYVTEAVYALAKLVFETFGAKRYEVRMDTQNERSWKVAERLGFALEGVLRNEALANDGSLRDTRVYAVSRLADLRLSVQKFTSM